MWGFFSPKFQTYLQFLEANLSLSTSRLFWVIFVQLTGENTSKPLQSWVQRLRTVPQRWLGNNTKYFPVNWEKVQMCTRTTQSHLILHLSTNKDFWNIFHEKKKNILILNISFETMVPNTGTPLFPEPTMAFSTKYYIRYGL